MTSNTTAREPLIRPALTLAELVEQQRADPDLPPRKRQELIAALNTLGRALGKSLQDIPAHPAALRAALKDVSPAMAGVSKGRWRNVLSLLRGALARADIAVAPGRCREARSPAWAALVGRLDDFRARHRLARLSGYCSLAGIEPAQVTDAVMDQFLENLKVQSIKGDPHRIHREAVLEWNRHAGVRPGWPAQQLTVPDRSRSYALAWEDFPASLRADVAAWLDRLAGKDPLAEHGFRPLRPASLRTRERQVKEFLSAIVLGGGDAAALRCLADAVTPERLAQGLRFLMARAGGKPSVHTGQVAGVVCSIARHHVGVERAQLERLDKVRRRATPKASGMAERNRERLRPFDDPQRVRDLLGLPARLLAEMRRAGAPTPKLALELQTAVAIELLIMVPVRIKNLAALRVGAELLRGRRGAMTLALREGDTKNGAPLEAVLPPETVRLVELYLSDYQPLLAARPSAWLFPARDGQGPKTEDALRQRIQRCIRERCGLAMHPHLFRHLAGKLTLDAQPGAYGQVRDILGHKSVNTTTLYYAGMEAKGALRRYDEQVLRLRDGEASPPPSARRRA